MEINIKLAESLIDAFDSEETGIILWDQNDNIAYRNKNISERFIKLNIDFEVGQNFFDRIKIFKKTKILTSDQINLRETNYVTAKKTGTPQQFVVKGPTGRWVQVKDTPTTEGNVLTLMTNVTEIVEQDLERKRLASAIENVPLIIQYWDEKDKLIFANAKADELHEQWKVNCKFTKGLAYEDMVRAQLLSKIFKVPEGETIESEIKRRKKYRKKVSSNYREVYLENGKTWYVIDKRLDDGSFLSIFSEITDIKNKEAQYKQLADALDNLPMPMLFWDKEDKLITSNKRSRQFQGKWKIKLEDGMSWESMFKKQIDAGVYVIPENKNIKDFTKERSNFRTELIQDRKRETLLSDGTTFFSNEIRLEDGSMLSVFTDISEIKEREKSLKLLNDAIEIIPNNMMLWDKNNKLIMANAKARDDNASRGFDLKKGASRLEMVKNALKKGFMTAPKGISPKDFLEMRKTQFESLKNQEAYEVIMNNKFYLLSSSRLPDGSTLQFATDINDTKKQEEELLRFKDGIDLLPNGLMFWDAEDNLIAHNASAVAFLKDFKFDLKIGKSREKLREHMILKGYVSVSKGVNKKEVFEKYKKDWKNLVGTRTRTNNFSNGKTLLFTDTRLQDGSTISLWTDVTDAKKQESELLRLKDGIETLPNGLMFWDENDDLIAFNKSSKNFLKDYGFDLKIGKNFSELRKHMLMNHQKPPKGVSVKDHYKNREKAWKNLKGQNIRESNFTNHTLHFSDTRLEDGSTICLWTDITEIKKQENELLRLKDAIDILPNGLFFWDENNKLIATNKSAIDHLKEFGFDLRLGVDRFDHVNHLVDHNYNVLQSGLDKKTHMKRMKESWDNFTGQRTRETKFSNGLSFLFTDTRLNDGSTISLWSDITKIRQVADSQKQLIDAIDVMPNSISLWNKDNKLIMANKTSINDMKKLNFDLKPGISRMSLVRNGVKLGLFPVPKGITRKAFYEMKQKEYEDLKDEKRDELELNNGSFVLNITKRLPDGGTLQNSINITEIKKGEKSLKQLRDSIEIIPNMLMLWDKDNHLIMANKEARNIQKKIGFDLKPGVSRWDMLDAGLKSGSIDTPDDTSPAEWIKNRKKAMVSLTTQEKVESVINLKKKKIVILGTSTRLNDGGTLQIWTDISEIREKERQVAESQRKVRDAEEKISNAINSMPHGITMWDKDMKLVRINDFGNRIWEKGKINLKAGSSYEDYMRQSKKNKFLIFDNKSDEIDYYKTAVERRKKFKGVFTTETPPFYDGSIWQSTSTRLPDGGVFSILSNITDIKNREASLKQLSDAIEVTPNAILLWDKDHKLVVGNKTARDIQKDLNFDLKPGILRKDMIDNVEKKGLVAIPEGISADEFYSQRRVATKSSKNHMYELAFTNGTTWLVSDTKLPDGGFLQVYSDISEMKEKDKEIKLAQDQIRETEKRMTDALNSMPHGISLWNKDDTLAMRNTLAFDIHKGAGIDTYQPGITYKEQTEAWKKYDFFDFDNQEQKKKFFKSIKDSRKDLKGSMTVETPRFYNGTYWQATYRRLDDGGVFTIFSDITELKKREEELNKTIKELDIAREKADAANQTKSQFLANMSHELRTPLNAIIGLTEMLKEDAADDGLDDFEEPLDRVFNAGKHLLTLINDVLDLSKIEAGRVELFNETFELKQILDDVIKTSLPLGQKNENELIIDYKTEIDFVTADQTRVKQVVLNLISNACKFTEKGKITVGVNKILREGGDLISIDVSDTGIGMSDEQMSRLFNSFVQADSSTTRKYGGTGLGLTISKQLAILMGGDVVVNSELGKGTTFTATFLADFIGASESVKNLQQKTGSLIENVITLENNTGKTILIIDDDPTVSELMKRQLLKEGYKVVIAPNGKEGISLARDLKPDVITLDILMPEMDGWSVLRTLKADPEVSNIPVIMASILDEKNKGFSLGAADFLSKPIQKEYLMKSIRNLIGDKENLKICLIEDDESLRFTVKEILEKQNVQIMEAENGKVGMNILQNEEIKPDLILLDLMMPVMNGFEFLKAIRETELNSIPILVLTGAELSENEKKFLSGETQRILEKSEDTMSTIVNEVSNVIKASSFKNGDNK